MLCWRSAMWQAVCLLALLGSALSAPVGQCPSSTPEGEQVFLPSDSSCAEFYLCSNGHPFLLICPGDLYFNPATSQCDFRSNVPCNITAAPPVAPPVAPLVSPRALRPADVPVCPDEVGPYPHLFPNPANCSTYYMCAGRVPVLMPCPEGLLFNNNTWTCDHPENVVCPELYAAVAGLGAGSPPPSDKCPSVDGKYPVLLPHPDDCRSFYICSHGTAYLKQCPSGLWFNNNTWTCDYPENVQCDASADVRPLSAAVRRPVALKLEFDNGCPAVDGKYPVFLPNPANCSTYFMCSHGVPYLYSCPDGLHFSIYTNTCDHPWRARCTETENTKSAAPVRVVKATEPAGSCPAEDGKYPTFLPNPYDCTTFYMCSHGVPYLHHCPAGLHFSIYTDTCDYSWRAGCTEIQDTKSVKSAMPATAVKATEPAGSCPAVDGKYPTFLSDPYDCNAFYMCSNGVPYLYHCPADLHFNIYTKTCDYPWRVPCNEIEHTEVAKVEPAKVPVKVTAPAGTCPESDGYSYPTFLPNDSDCSSYYMCSHGEPYLFNCPEGLHFNARLKVCDYPWRAGCTVTQGVKK